VFRGYYKMPAPQTEQENCVAHNGSIVPVPGRDIFVQAWYQGGVSVIDFTDSANPVEIAYFDRGPVDAEHLVGGGYWSAYWYHGRIYGTEIVRGLDVFKLLPGEYLTENEIAAAAIADQGALFNPQQQFRVTWPAEPVVARAYLDQLDRDEAMPDKLVSDVAAALDLASRRIEDGGADENMALKLQSLAVSLQDKAASNAITARRRASLAEALLRLADRLRPARPGAQKL
jgi:hypothetical protein